MEQITNIDGYHLYLTASKEQIETIMQDMLACDSRELVLAPDPDSEDRFLGIVLEKHYTPLLSKWFSVMEDKEEGAFHFIVITAKLMRSYLHFLARRCFPTASAPVEEVPAESTIPWEPDPLPQHPFVKKTNDLEADTNPLDDQFTAFLKKNAPAQIEQALNQRVIGQPELTKAVADFLYYHALRQLHPSLPQRPLLVAGPSGSGKTEVWRVASQLYGHLFPIKVIDGSSISCEGWAGNYKIDTYMNPCFADGGILVVDEFDKLTKPKHTSAGENVSHEVQAEFLKLVEGEYVITEKKKQTNKTTKMMGFVLVGAFEQLWIQKEQPAAIPHIGFCTDTPAVVQKTNTPAVLTDEDFIAYGILPELVGRIAVKCATKPLNEDAYMDIIRGPHSRVAAIEQVLRQYGTEITDVISAEELRQMVATSKSNRTGVRWVSAQVENRLLEAIREHGLFPTQAA